MCFLSDCRSSVGRLFELLHWQHSHSLPGRLGLEDAQSLGEAVTPLRATTAGFFLTTTAFTALGFSSVNSATLLNAALAIRPYCSHHHTGLALKTHGPFSYTLSTPQARTCRSSATRWLPTAVLLQISDCHLQVVATAAFAALGFSSVKAF